MKYAYENLSPEQNNPASPLMGTRAGEWVPRRQRKVHGLLPKTHGILILLLRRVYPPITINVKL